MGGWQFRVMDIGGDTFALFGGYIGGDLQAAVEAVETLRVKYHGDSLTVDLGQCVTVEVVAWGSVAVEELVELRDELRLRTGIMPSLSLRTYDPDIFPADEAVKVPPPTAEEPAAATVLRLALAARVELETNDLSGLSDSLEALVEVLGGE